MHQGNPRVSGALGPSGVHWGADRECRYSGASKGISGIRHIGGY